MSNNSNLEEQLVDLNTECESLKSQLMHYKKEIEIHKSEIATLKETNEELTNKDNSSADKIQQITAQLNSYNVLNTNFDEINAKNITLNKDIIKYKEHIKHYESENQKLVEQIEEYKLKSAQNIRLSKSKNKLLDNHKQTEMVQSSKIKELQDQIQILNSELTILKSMPSHDDDDEKAHKITGYTLPALLQNDTLKVKVRTPCDDYIMNKNETPTYMIRQGSTTSVVTPAKTYNHIIGYNQFSPLSNSDETNIASVGGIGTMYAEQSIVSTTSTAGGTVLLNGYELASVAQQKDNEYQLMLLQQKQKYDAEIKMLIEKEMNEENDSDELKNEIANLKRENMMLKQRLKNAWEIKCITPSWFTNDIDD